MLEDCQKSYPAERGGRGEREREGVGGATLKFYFVMKNKTVNNVRSARPVWSCQLELFSIKKRGKKGKQDSLKETQYSKGRGKLWESS